MFAGRFRTEKDAQFGASWQTLSSAAIAQVEGAGELVAAFAARQRSRQHLVGCTDWVVMECTMRQVCAAIEENLCSGNQFLFGTFPTNADFALFGQMRQWAGDPLSCGVMHEYPAAWGWVWRVDDLSGVDDPQVDSVVFGEGVVKLLALAANTYAPFMLANLLAAESKKHDVVAVLFRGASREVEHRQPMFPYQARCLRELRQLYGELSVGCKERVDQVLASAGFETNVFEEHSRL